MKFTSCVGLVAAASAFGEVKATVLVGGAHAEEKHALLQNLPRNNLMVLGLYNDADEDHDDIVEENGRDDVVLVEVKKHGKKDFNPLDPLDPVEVEKHAKKDFNPLDPLDLVEVKKHGKNDFNPLDPLDVVEVKKVKVKKGLDSALTWGDLIEVQHGKKDLNPLDPLDLVEVKKHGKNDFNPLDPLDLVEVKKVKVKKGLDSALTWGDLSGVQHGKTDFNPLGPLDLVEVQKGGRRRWGTYKHRRRYFSPGPR